MYNQDTATSEQVNDTLSLGGREVTEILMNEEEI
jgi:hypothetical protein